MGIRRAVLRPSLPLFVMAMVAYGYFYQAGGWNQNVRFDLTRAVAEHGTVKIDRYHFNTGDKSCLGPNGRCVHAHPGRGEHYYCDKAPGVSLLGVPSYALAWWLAGSERPSSAYLVATSHLVTVMSIALPSALAISALFGLLGVMGLRPSVSALLALGWGFSTLAFPYATLLYGHQLAAALLLMGFALLVRARRQPDRTAPGAGEPALAGALLGYAVVSEYPAALAVIPITTYALMWLRPWRRLGWFVLGGAACALLLAAYHTVAFGGPLTLPYEFSTQKYRGLGYFMGLGPPNWEAFWNTMFSSYRGLFYSAPWLLAALPGAVLWWWRGYRAEAAVCAASFVLFMWMVASLIESWHGGWSLGSRYMIPAIPFLVVLVGGLAAGPSAVRARAHAASPERPADRPSDRRRPRWLRWLAWALALPLLGHSALLMLAGTAVRPEVPQHIAEPFGGYLLPHFYAGKLAVNTQHIDRGSAPQQGPREAWNLGMLLGLDGLASLAPLALTLALCGVWLLLAVRAQSAAPGSPRGSPGAEPAPSP